MNNTMRYIFPQRDLIYVIKPRILRVDHILLNDFSSLLSCCAVGIELSLNQESI